MINSKQRANLRSLASTISPTVIIGKEGLTETVVKQVEDALFSRELVKIAVLESAEKSAKEYLGELSEKLGAEQVCSIGRRFVLYKYSTKKGVKHIEF